MLYLLSHQGIQHTQLQLPPTLVIRIGGTVPSQCSKHPNPVGLSGSTVWTRVCVYVCMLSRFSCVWLFASQTARLLCPWDSPGKKAGLGFHAHLQGIFLISDQTACLMSSALVGGFITTSTTEKPLECFALYVTIFLNTLKASLNIYSVVSIKLSDFHT